MIQENYRKSEVDRLVQRLREDDLDEAGQAALRDIIRNHPKERRRVAQQLYVEAHLKEALGLVSGSGEKGGGRGWFLPVVLSGVAVLAGMLIWVYAGEGAEEESGGDGVVMVNTEEEGVAVLSRSAGVVWKDDVPKGLKQRDGRSLLSPGMLEIESGVLQLDFYVGATVLVLGPAEFEVVGVDCGVLHSGKATIKVSLPAREFSLGTPHFEAEDSEGEYGVWARPMGRSEIHVLAGKAKLVDSSGGKVEVGEQAARRFTDQGSAEIELSAEEFLRPWILDEEAKRKLERWKRLRTRLVNDPDVVLFFSFGRSSEWRRDIPNEAVAAPEDSDGAVVGCFAAEGRWPGKSALGFDNSSNRVRVHVPGEFDSLTLSTWIRIDEFPSKLASLFHSESRQDEAIIWSLITPPRAHEESIFQAVHLHFSETHREGGKTDRVHYHSKVSKGKLFRTSEWVQVAVVYDREAGKVRHFANGKVVFENDLVRDRGLGIGTADIGNWPYSDWAEGTEFEVRNIVGAMGEFLLAKRAFTEGEIREIYEKGKP